MGEDSSAAPARFDVLIAGGGVAALECALGLADLAPGRTRTTLLAPDPEFVYRPLAVREPFSYGSLTRYPLRAIADDLGAELVVDRLGWVDPVEQVAHAKQGAAIRYDALVIASGALARPRYAHAITIDDRHLEETLHGLIQDIEGGYVHQLAFVIPGRMAWPLPIYELALMSAGRAFDMGVELEVTIVTPEDRPLEIFGDAASDAVEELLARAKVSTITDAYAEVPAPGEITIEPGDRALKAERIVALPELFGPPLRGLPTGDHGFLRADPHGRLHEVGPVYAAGDATDFPVKHGGLAAQQADAVAEAIAELAGATVAPQPFAPVVKGMLLTDSKPLYLSARITGGQGFSSEVSTSPLEPRPAKIAAKYLAPYLRERDAQPA